MHVSSNLVVSFNLRALAELCRKRSSMRVQGEYNEVVRQMRSLLISTWPWVEPFFAMKLISGKPLGEVQVSTVAFDMMNILRRHRVRVNPVYTMANVAIAVTEGIGKQLDPTLDLVQAALPFFISLRQQGKL